ncbi:MAG: ABC transporter ATP-binding protein [Christensenellales bacterium]|jgi:ATP-binding cassette subfamily B multidrug efflux pump
MDTTKRLVGLIKPYRWQVVSAMAMQLLVIISRMIAPLVQRSIINNVIPNRALDRLGPLCALLIALVIVRAAGNYQRGLQLERVSQDVVYDLRTRLYRHMQSLPYQFYDKHRIGEIMSRMTGDIEGVRNLIAGGLVTIFDNLLNFIGALFFLSFLSWELMLSLLIFAPILAVTAWKFRARIHPAFVDIREQNAVLNTRTQENLAGMRVVKAFAREPYEFDEFVKDNRKLLGMNLKATWIWSDFVPLMELLSGLCTPVMLIVGAALTLNGRMDIGTLVAVNGYVWLITNPMRQLANIVNMVTNAVTSAEKLFYYIDFGAAIRDKPDAAAPDAYTGRVEFDHVYFAYGDHPVLKDITFTAEPGQTIAVMGATGSGKSTLTLLLGRFYDVSRGSVKIDGVDVRDQPMKKLREKIGYVPQETFLFSDTLADNMRFGHPDAEMARVEAAADVAQATEFVRDMPEGYETVVGERGMGLSGGQKQRTAIARAVLTDPAILVMDDSTSAVDMETEYVIQQKLQDVLRGRTTFIIAHRISSVKNADMILVLDDGEIAERGTHKELLAMGGIYHRMVQDQYRDLDSVKPKGGA